jgi:hypothetical protein
VSRFVFFGFILIAAYFLITEHRAHLVGFVPFLLLAACLLLHFLHHRGHYDGGEGSPPSRPSGSDGPQAPMSGGHSH